MVNQFFNFKSIEESTPKQIPKLLRKANASVSDHSNSALTVSESLEALAAYFQEATNSSDAIAPYLNAVIENLPTAGFAGKLNYPIEKPEDAVTKGWYSENSDLTPAILEELLNSNVNDGDEFSLVVGEFGHVYRFQTIDSQLYNVSTFSNAAGVQTTKLPLLFQGKVLNTWVQEGYGYYRQAWRVVKDINSSSVINELFLSAIQQVGREDFNFSNFAARFSDRIKYFSDPAKTVYAQIRDAFSVPDPNGVIQVLKRYFTALNTVKQSGNGIQFTDNSEYVVKSFLNGIMTGAFETLGNVVSGILFACSKVLGSIAFVLTQIGKGIGALVSRSWTNAVNASINPSSPVRTFPFSTVAGVVPASAIPESAKAFGGGTIHVCYGSWKVWPSKSDDLSAAWNAELFLTTLIDAPLPADGSLGFTATYDDSGPYCSVVVSQSDADTVRDWVENHQSDLAEIQGSLTDDELDAALRARYRHAYAAFLLSCYGMYENGTGSQEVGVIARRVPFTGSYDSYPTLESKQTAVVASGIFIGSSASNAVGLTWDQMFGENISHRCIYFQAFNDVLKLQPEPNTQYPGMWLSDALAVVRRDQKAYTLLPVSTYFDFVKMPRYTRASVVAGIMVGVIATVTITIIGTLLFFKARKAYRTMLSSRQAAVESAWYEFTSAQSKEDKAKAAAKYQAAVRKNNLLATFTGGTKYSMVNYWDDYGGTTVVSALSAARDINLDSIYAVLVGEHD